MAVIPAQSGPIGSRLLDERAVFDRQLALLKNQFTAEEVKRIELRTGRDSLIAAITASFIKHICKKWRPQALDALEKAKGVAEAELQALGTPPEQLSVEEVLAAVRGLMQACLAPTSAGLAQQNWCHCSAAS